MCGGKKIKKNWVGLSVGSNVLLKYGLYVVCHLSKWFTFSCLFNGHFLLCRVVIRLHLTFCSYKKLAISKHKTVNLHKSLIEKLNFNKPPNHQFLIGAVSGCPFIYHPLYLNSFLIISVLVVVIF